MQFLRHISVFFICCVSLGGYTGVYSAETTDTCGQQTGWSMYECRVTNICEQYASAKPVYNSVSFQRAEEATTQYLNEQDTAPALSTAKRIYKENMGNIYKCAIIQTQKNTLNTMAQTLLQETSGRLNDTLRGQIDTRVSRLDLSASTIGCSQSDTQSIQNKLNILRETTYQACQYTSYLSYLDAYYAEYSNITPDDIPEDYSIPLGELPNMVSGIHGEIAQEIEHTYKIFPIAYQAYSEYENNFAIHFLLEILRSDFLVLRQQLYATLMPIAQLGIKAINATSY